MILQPGGTIGVLGGGQLGRMTSLAAHAMGYHVHIFEPSPNCPAGQVSEQEFNASYEDPLALDTFARSVDVVTLEFENIPAEVPRKLRDIVPMHPKWEILHICQNREREKAFLKNKGYPHAPFAVVNSEEDLFGALKNLGCPSVLKTASFGYDGKGQTKITTPGESTAAWKNLGAPSGVLEAWIPFSLELSVICARNEKGECQTFPAAENIHTNHILDLSIVPARIEPKKLQEARELATAIAEDLGVIGLLAVEMFLTEDGKLLINELAPRSHNSGHYTLDACLTSQFEQHVRAVCGLPLGDPRLSSPVVMLNLLGDLWKGGHEDAPDWQLILDNPLAKLHLYGKQKARPGRKMGHVNVVADTVDEAFQAANLIKEKLLATAEN